MSHVCIHDKCARQAVIELRSVRVQPGVWRSVCSITSETCQAQTLIRSGGGVSGKRQGTYGGANGIHWSKTLELAGRPCCNRWCHVTLWPKDDRRRRCAKTEGREKRTCRRAESERPAAGLLRKHASIYCLFTIFDYSSLFRSRFDLIWNYLLIQLCVSVPNMFYVDRGRCGAIGRFCLRHFNTASVAVFRHTEPFKCIFR